MPDKIYARRVELMEAELGDELVALDVDGGSCFGFNGVATAVWRLLVTPKSLDHLRTHLLADYDVDADQCGAEVQQLLDDLVAKRLIHVI